MTIFVGDNPYTSIPISETASDGTWFKFGLIGGRPEIIVIMGSPLSLAATVSDPPYRSIDKVINVYYKINAGENVIKQGYIRSKRQTILLSSANMTQVAAYVGLNFLNVKYQPDAFGLQIWKPSDQYIDVAVNKLQFV